MKTFKEATRVFFLINININCADYVSVWPFLNILGELGVSGCQEKLVRFRSIIRGGVLANNTISFFQNNNIYWHQNDNKLEFELPHFTEMRKVDNFKFL